MWEPKAAFLYDALPGRVRFGDGALDRLPKKVLDCAGHESAWPLAQHPVSRGGSRAMEIEVDDSRTWRVPTEEVSTCAMVSGVPDFDEEVHRPVGELEPSSLARRILHRELTL